MTADRVLPDDELVPSRYVVGLDLGTTNSAVCYVDTREERWQVRTFLVPQLVDAGVVEPRETLPSFHYEPQAGELAADALHLPWSVATAVTNAESHPYVVGMMARDWGALMPGRLISSAKSWLCHSGVDRTAPLLPWHGAADVERLSPVQVSARYLQHIHDAWNARFADHPLAEQDLVVTLPASFDEVARELTVAAAAQAGLTRVVLIEEPQAAFYAWINKHAQDWESEVSPGQKILVCDIGGGTSDFTLIRVRRGAEGRVQFHRVAVGEHLILGGDNLDLALARHMETLAVGEGKLEPRQWDLLLRQARQAKEKMLSATAPETLTVNLPSSGSRLIGGGLQLTVTRDEVQQLLVEGFFPPTPLDAKPARHRSGFREFGLPYAADAAVTRYLANFLTTHRYAGEAMDRTNAGAAAGAESPAAAESLSAAESTSGAQQNAGNQPSSAADPARPDIVLYNGGVFESPQLRERLLEVLSDWFSLPGEPRWTPRLLDNDRLDLAVARGAAYYGMVRRGAGVRIAAGLARSYYLGVASDPPQAVCIVPGNTEAGQEVDLSSCRFDLLISQPAEFRLYVSSIRLADRAGEVFAVDPEQMTPLPPIRTVLRTQRRSEVGTVPVELHARLTEIGTLDLWCSEVAGPRSWRLQFDVRAATETDREGHAGLGEQAGFVDEQTWQRCEAELQATFGDKATAKPDGLIKRLVAASELDREAWPPSFLRRLWEAAMSLAAGRRKSAAHEARWLNLLGYALRPGYGLAVDDWRVAETWRHVQGKLAFGTPATRTESLILWRRLAGGLTAGQQRAIADPLLPTIRGYHQRLTTGKGGETGFAPHEAAEVWRLLGSLELLQPPVKQEIGRMLLEMLDKRSVESVRPAIRWAIGRLGARVPVYGPLNTVVTSELAEQWLRKLMQADDSDPMLAFAVMQLARRTGDRYRDISDAARQRVLGWMVIHDAPPHLQELVRTVGDLDRQEQGRLFGEALPLGLSLS